MYKLSFTLACVFLILSGCNPDKNKKVDQTTISFATNDASKLFFKNLRQPYYDKEEMAAAKMDVYRLKKRNTANEHPVINLAIVNNWRYDEAYLLLEPNSLLSLSELAVSWVKESSREEGTVSFENGNKQSIVRFADQIYALIQQEATLTVSVGDKSMDILETAEDREAFRITMVDYYRLVQRL